MTNWLIKILGGIYKLKFNTCNNLYVGQSVSSINVRHKEHVRYITTDDPISAYTLRILQNRHECGTIAYTLQLLKACSKGTCMNCWLAFIYLFMQIFHQHKTLITDQKFNDPNPLYELANTTRILPSNP
jgi:hypothetical protein